MPANQNRNGDMHNEVLRLVPAVFVPTGNAEIHDLDAAVGQEHDIGGFDVAMDYTPVVRRTES